MYTYSFEKLEVWVEGKKLCCLLLQIIEHITIIETEAIMILINHSIFLAQLTDS